MRAMLAAVAADCDEYYPAHQDFHLVANTYWHSLEVLGMRHSGSATLAHRSGHTPQGTGPSAP